MAHHLQFAQAAGFLAAQVEAQAVGSQFRTDGGHPRIVGRRQRGSLLPVAAVPPGHVGVGGQQDVGIVGGIIRAYLFYNLSLAPL